MKNKSFFYTILKCSLVMMILPLVTTILLFLWTENTMKDHIQQTSDRTLNQFLSLADQDMEDFRDACIALGENRECQKYASYGITDPDMMGYQALLVKQELMKLHDYRLAEILIYYPHTDRIISGPNGVASADDYFVSFFGDITDYRERFAAILECVSKQPILLSVDIGEEDETLCVAMRKKYIGDHQQDFIIVLMLQNNYLSELMEKNELKDSGSLMIFDKQRELLISSDHLMHYNMSDYNGETALYDLKTEQGTYIMQVVPSKSVDGYYGFAVDSEEFWQELKMLRFWCVAIIVVCVLVNIVVAFYGTQKVFKPVKGVVKKIEKEGFPRYNQLEHSEMEFIERILELSTERNKASVTEKKTDTLLARDRLIFDTLRGEKVATKADLEKFGLCEHSDRYMVALLFVQQKNDMDSQMQGFILKNTFEEIAGFDGWGILIDQGPNQYALLMNLAENVSTKKRLEDLRACQQYISQQLDMKFIISLGSCCRGIENISQSHDEASLAMRYQYLLSASGVICYEDVKDRGFNYFPHLESALSQKIINYIGDREQKIPEEQFVAEIVDMCGIDGNSSMESIECFKYEILSALNKAYLIAGGAEDQKECLAELMTQPNWELFRAQLVKNLKYLSHVEHSGNRQDKICMHCMRYIQEHYSDPGLSITALGDEFQMSPYYVSQLFKSKYGVSVPDYITKIRIEHAKADLVSSGKSVKHIAEENGFVNSNVFIRNFKRYEGMTPGEYRKEKEVVR